MILLGILMATLLNGCVAIIKNYSGHPNVINKEYNRSQIDLDQEYKNKAK